MRLAKTAFQKAVELDPELSEGYTALSELAVGMAPIDVDESIRLASTAVKIAPLNFGGHRMLARLYTVKSRLNNGTLDADIAAKAIDEWKQITRLDPRNAEGWAFLSAFSEAKDADRRRDRIFEEMDQLGLAARCSVLRAYNGLGRCIDAWNASIKLGRALLKTGKKAEAVETLSVLLADDPENGEAIDLLTEAVDSADQNTRRCRPRVFAAGSLRKSGQCFAG